MALRKQPNQLESDATEFGVGVKCGGWRLGLLVARNVELGKAGRPKNENHSLVNDSSKVSMNKFAELADVPVSKVKYYFDAWEHAAAAHLVPSAGSIQPGDDDVAVDIESIEVENDPKTQWSWFYSLAVHPPKPKEAPKDSEPKQQESKSPVKESSGDDDESDSVDSDFGIASFTKEEAAEADSSIQRNALLEILETVRAMNSRIESAGRPTNSDNEGLLGKIAGAALEVNMTADALMAKEDATNN